MRHLRGFSLLVVLGLLAGFCALTYGLLAFLPVASAEQASAVQRTRLRQDASALLRLALAETQAAAGSDRVATWMEDAAAVAARATPLGREVVRLSGERVVDGVRWRWRCEDVSCGYDAWAAGYVAIRAGAWARGQVGRQAFASGHAATIPNAEQARAWAWGDEALCRALSGGPSAPGQSWGGWGLLTDPVHGGWKRDLASARGLTDLVGRDVAAALVAADLREDRALGLPVQVAEGQEYAFRHFAPLVDLRLSLGFFNARSDGRHRMRFHVSGLLWNPASAPLLAEAEGRLYLLEVVGAPEVSVRNLTTGTAVEVDLDDCPVGDLGIFSQYRREAGLWSWIEVADESRHGMARRGLLPGECYAFFGPSPVGQPQGLARVLSRDTWRYESSPRGPGWRRPSPKVFLPQDRIEVSVRFVSPMSVRLRRVVGEPDRDAPIGDYPGPIVQELANLWFPDFRWEMSGQDYSRPDSAGYTWEERRACLRLSWIPRDWAGLGEAMHQHDLLRTRWDLSRPEQAAQWTIHHPLSATVAPLDWSGAAGVGVLQDAAVNQHLAQTRDSYADLRLRGLPGLPLVSIGALRHLRPTMDWARLDDSFCSAPLRKPEVGCDSENPRLKAAAWSEGSSPGWMIAGPFNVNSVEPEAWLGFLRSSASPWQVQAGGPFASPPLNRPFWPSQPAGAHLAQWAAARPPSWTDEELAQLGPDEVAPLSARQPVRFPEDRKLVELAQALVRLQPEVGAPFASLEAFARSGLLRKALVAARLDELPGATVDGWLAAQEADLLEQWAPLLTVRGDTLRLHGQVAFADPRRRGGLAFEAILQRTPATHPVGRCGRVWRVVQVRFL